MLELKLKPEESHFLHGLEAMLHLVDVASLDCNRAGLKLRAVHPKHIGVIALHFDANDFQKYSCDKFLSMGIPIDYMVEVIRRADKDDTIAITVGDENLETITISFESPSQMNNTVTCELPLLDGSSHRFNILDWQYLKPKYQAFVQMPPVEFMRACKSLVNIDDDGHITVTNKGLKFFASGKSGRVNIMYMQPATDVTYSMEAPVSLTFDMNYMYSIAQACTPFDQVEICLSTTELLIVQCKIKQMGYIKFHLLPKVKRETEINGSGEEDKGSAASSGNEEGSAATLLELKLEKESLFFMGLEAMLHLVGVGSIDCSSTGLKILVVDPEHIAVFALLCPAKDFQLYRCNKLLSMGIPINNMVKAIDCAHKDDTITICCKNLHTITISFESPSQNNTTTYDLLVVDDSSHHVSSHRFNMDWQNVKPKYQAFVHMPSAKFMRVLECLSNIRGDGDGHISVTNKGLKFFASGKSGCVNIKYKQNTAVTCSMGAPVSLAFGMKYMYSIAKASTLFDKVVICLATTEVMVECKISQTGYIRFFLAPKVIRATEFAEILEEQQKGKKSRETEEIKKKAKIK